MLVCNNCEKIIDRNSLGITCDKDYVNNGLGMECVREDYWYEDCGCGGDWVDATECKVCGEWFNDEHYREICDDCLDENATFENAIKFGNEEDCKTEIKINGYLASEYSVAEIEELILKDLKEANSAGFVSGNINFCLSDKEFFAGWLKKEKEDD